MLGELRVGAVAKTKGSAQTQPEEGRRCRKGSLPQHCAPRARGARGTIVENPLDAVYAGVDYGAAEELALRVDDKLRMPPAAEADVA
eukprot:7949502-Alexandrium_andersonii.AAC.1